MACAAGGVGADNGEDECGLWNEGVLYHAEGKRIRNLSETFAFYEDYG